MSSPPPPQNTPNPHKPKRKIPKNSWHSSYAPFHIMVIGPKLGSGIFASGGASKHETIDDQVFSGAALRAEGARYPSPGRALGSVQRPRRRAERPALKFDRFSWLTQGYHTAKPFVSRILDFSREKTRGVRPKGETKTATKNGR